MYIIIYLKNHPFFHFFLFCFSSNKSLLIRSYSVDTVIHRLKSEPPSRLHQRAQTITPKFVRFFKYFTSSSMTWELQIRKLTCNSMLTLDFFTSIIFNSQFNQMVFVSTPQRMHCLYILKAFILLHRFRIDAFNIVPLQCKEKMWPIVNLTQEISKCQPQMYEGCQTGSTDFPHSNTFSQNLDHHFDISSLGLTFRQICFFLCILVTERQNNDLKLIGQNNVTTNKQIYQFMLIVNNGSLSGVALNAFCKDKFHYCDGHENKTINEQMFQSAIAEVQAWLFGFCCYS